TDDNFLIKISSCSNAVIENAKLADKRAGSAAVKEFAAALASDHQKCQDRLANVVKNRKIAIVTGLEQDKRAEHDRLSKLSGADFDREFLAWVIKTHKDGVAMFDNQVEKGQNAEIRSFAKENVATLRDHLKRAEELAKTAK